MHHRLAALVITLFCTPAFADCDFDLGDTLREFTSHSTLIRDYGLPVGLPLWDIATRSRVESAYYLAVDLNFGEKMILMVNVDPGGADHVLTVAGTFRGEYVRTADEFINYAHGEVASEIWFKIRAVGSVQLECDRARLAYFRVHGDGRAIADLIEDLRALGHAPAATGDAH